MTKSSHMSRRDFVKAVTGILGALISTVVGIPAIAYLISPGLASQETEAWIPVGSLDKIPDNKPFPFSFTRSKINGWEKTVNSYGGYVIKKGPGQITALTNQCTHLSCRVTWHEDKNLYICPCHDGRFDESGNVVFGPPPKPLPKYETKVDKNILYIHFKEA